MPGARKAFFGTLILAALLLAQTRIHGPTQVRDFAEAGGAVSWYYGPLSFGTVPAGQCAELSFPAHGVSPGQTLAPGWPPNLPAGVHGIMYGGPGIIVVRLCAAQSSTIPPLTYSAAAFVWR